MSLRYRLFRIPRDVGEFVDKIRRRRRFKKVNIEVKRVGHFGYYEIILHAVGCDLRVRFKVEKVGIWLYTNCREVALERIDLAQALEIAKMLQGIGAEVRINFRKTSEVEARIKECEVEIGKAKSGYPSIF